MLVTAIEQTKRGRLSIFVDGAFYCALHMDVFAASRLQTGVETTPQELETLRLESEQKITRDRAMRLLGGRSYTEQGLYRKLCEKADEQSAAAAVARMVELGLVNDQDYARRFAADCVNLKGFSHRRTLQELVRKGIDRQLAEDVLAERGEDAEQAIAAIIKRKYARYLADEKGTNKTMNALIRLGYGYSDIRAVIGNLQEDEDYYESE